MKNKIISLILALCLTLLIIIPAASPIISYAAEETIYISTTEDFINFAKKCSYDVWSKSKTVILENDISLLGIAFDPIPTFSGCFDGNGKTVSGLDIQDSHAPAGLFATLENGGVIKNLTVQGSVCPEGERALVGGIVGNNFGQIENCAFIGTVVGKTDVGGIAGANGFSGSITDCKTNATVIGETRTGGIAGSNKGLISSSVSSSKVNNIDTTPALSLDGLDISLTLDINKLTSLNSSGRTDAGGICGYSTGMIIGCKNNGQVGYPHIGYNVGGIVGRSSGHLSGNTNNAQIYGRKDVGGIVGQIEPYVSYNLSEDLLAALKSELDQLSVLVNGAVEKADGDLPTLNERLDNILDGIDGASDSLEKLLGNASDYGDDFIGEINRFSEILSEVISQFADIGNGIPELTELISNGLDSLESALKGLEEISSIGSEAISDINLAILDTATAFGKIKDAMDKIDGGIALLESSIEIKDKDEASSALGSIADGIGDAVRGLDTVTKSFTKLSEIIGDAAWIDDSLAQFSSLAIIFKDTATAMSDIYDATKEIEENIDIYWDKLIEGGDQLTVALGHFSDSIAKLNGALDILDEGLGNIKSGLEIILSAFNSENQEGYDEAIRQITEGMEKLVDASAIYSDALLELSEMLGNIESFEQLSKIGDAIGKLAESSSDIAIAMLEVSNGLTDILSNTKIDFDSLSDGGSLVIGGMGDTTDAMKKMKDSLASLSDGMIALNNAINLIKEAVSINDEAALKTALGKIYDALGKITDSIGSLADLMLEIADTMEEARAWSEGLINALNQLSSSLSAVTGALVKVQDGVDCLRENISLDGEGITEGLALVREGFKDFGAAFGFIEESLLHLSDALDTIDVVSAKLPTVISDLKNAIGSFKGLSYKMTSVAEKCNILIGYLNGSDPIQLPTISEGMKSEAGNLFSCISIIESELKLLNADLNGIGEDMIERIGKINQIFNRISDDIEKMISGLKDSIIDNKVYEEQIDSVTNGKIFSCINYGNVHGDINVGGIGGVMGLEFALDPEDDNTAELTATQKKQYSLKAVIHASINYGDITSKYDAVGGIVGKMDFGLIYGCEAYALIQSESGNYVGGIAGITAGLISQCFVKSTLSGGKYVGGIVGAGVTEDFLGDSSMVRNNYSMVEITGYTQYAGAISGANIGQFSENLFVSGTLSGIDRVSYKDKAEPISYEDLIKRRVLPTGFYSFILKFVADGTVLSTVEFTYGESFDSSVFPKIPSKAGYYGYWNTTELENLVFDTKVEVIYKPYVTALVSEEKRDNGRVIFLIEGEFTDSCKITVSSSANVKKLELHDKFFSNDSLVECWTVEIPKDNMENNTIHFLPRNDNCKIFINVDGAWQEVEASKFGSYLLFDVSGEAIELAIVEHTVKPLPIIVVSVIALATIGAVTAIIIIKKKKAKA